MIRRLALLVLVALSSSVLPQSAAADPSCPLPRCRDVRVAVPKGLKVPDSRVRVLLPEGYERGGRRYPVLYLLHGVGDTYTSWSENTDVVEFSRRLPVIIVMPDGGRGPEAGWYSDWRDGSRQWESFHTEVLVRYIDRRFRTTKRRAVAGASMGGFGAMKYSARHPRLFRAAATFSGAVDTMYAAPASGPVFHFGGQGVGDQSIGTPNENVWGDQLSDEQTWRDHNPTDRAGDLKDVWLYVATGMGTPGGEEGEDPSRPHAYANENFIWQMNMNFTGALDDAGVPYESDFHAGYHHWPYWQRDLHRVLPQLMNVISR